MKPGILTSRQSEASNKSLSAYIYIKVVCIIIVLSFICSHNFYQLMLIQGASMESAYHNLQLVLISRRFADLNDLAIGDVVAVKTDKLECDAHGQPRTVIIVKRIAAIPGDTVVIDESGSFLVNGTVPEFYRDTIFSDAGVLCEIITLDSTASGDAVDQYLLIGDNVDLSKDSRVIGAVKEDQIVGKIVFSFF